MKTIMLTALLLSVIVAGIKDGNMENQQVNTIEVVIFTVKEGLSEKDVLDKAITVNDFISRQPGFINRKLSKIGKEKWIDIVCWESLEEAKKASEKALQSEETVPFFSIIEEQSMEFFHAEVKLSLN